MDAIQAGATAEGNGPMVTTQIHHRALKQLLRVAETKTPKATPCKQDRSYEEHHPLYHTHMNHEQVLASFSKSCNLSVGAVSG